MLPLMQSEWERMWKRKKTVVSLIIFAAVIVFDCLFLKMQMIGAFDTVRSVPLNAQNFSVFLLKEVSFILTLIIGPLLMIDSLNSENTSGQLRLVLIRPITFSKLFLAKWLTLAIMLMIFTCLTFLIGEVAGHLGLPNVAHVTFLNPNRSYDQWGAFNYSLQSYGLFYLIILAELSVVSLICTIMPNSIISYFIWIGVIVGGLYLTDMMSFFLLSASTIFKLLAGSYKEYFYLPVLGCLGGGFLATMFIWNKKNWSK
ncbi:ABC-2 family transporter protein [compost metagenome]